MATRMTLDFKYDDEDYKSVYDFGDFIKKTCMLMRDSDMKWQFYSRADTIQNTLHVSPKIYSIALEKLVVDIVYYLREHPDDKHFIIEKKDMDI